MTMSRQTAEKLILVLKDLDAGYTITGACKRQQMSTQVFNRWRNKLIGQGKKPLERLVFLENENRRLKQKIAELSLDYNALRAALVNETRREC